MRRAARRFVRALLARRARPAGPGVLNAVGAVFAPHPDDEALGCGRTLIRRAEAGTRTVVEFLPYRRESPPIIAPRRGSRWPRGHGRRPGPLPSSIPCGSGIIGPTCRDDSHGVPATSRSTFAGRSLPRCARPATGSTGAPGNPYTTSCPAFRTPSSRVEFAHEELRHRANRVEFELTTWRGQVRGRSIEFEYDPSPVNLPCSVDWEVVEPDTQDGRWERVRREGTTFVRPAPDAEWYNRLVVACGAFAAGREITLDLVFHGAKTPGLPFGFGVLPIWGGRPSAAGVEFSLVWYYSHYDAVGMEFSQKDGPAPPAWTASYRSIDLVLGQRCRVRVRCWPERDESGAVRRHVQRMKRWPAGAPEPQTWMEHSDDEGSPIPPGEYAVAVIAHHSLVEFGPLRIEPYDPGAGAPEQDGEC